MVLGPLCFSGALFGSPGPMVVPRLPCDAQSLLCFPGPLSVPMPLVFPRPYFSPQIPCSPRDQLWSLGSNVVLYPGAD